MATSLRNGAVVRILHHLTCTLWGEFCFKIGERQLQILLAADISRVIAQVPWGTVVGGNTPLPETPFHGSLVLLGKEGAQ